MATVPVVLHSKARAGARDGVLHAGGVARGGATSLRSTLQQRSQLSHVPYYTKHVRQAKARLPPCPSAQCMKAIICTCTKPALMLLQLVDQKGAPHW